MMFSYNQMDEPPSGGVAEEMNAAAVAATETSVVAEVVEETVTESTAESAVSADTPPVTGEDAAPPTPSESRRERHERRVQTHGMAALLMQLRGGAEEQPAPCVPSVPSVPATTPETAPAPVDVPAESVTPVETALPAESGEEVDALEALAQQQLDEAIAAGLPLNRKQRRMLAMRGQPARDYAKEAAEAAAAAKAQASATATTEAASTDPVPCAVEECENVPPKRQRVVVEYDWQGAGQRPERELTDEYRGTAPDFGFSSQIRSNNYVKWCGWSADGSLLATASQDRRLRFFKYTGESGELSSPSSVCLGDLPYDQQWHPWLPLLAASSKDHPVHVWDGGAERRASYRGINHLDELSAAYSVCWTRDGRALLAGYKKCIRVFDVERPGRQVREVKTWNKDQGGQKSIISTLAVHPVFDGVYAAGCYGTSIALYSDRSNSIDCLFTGDFSATTQIRYSRDGLRLYSSARKDSRVFCWDLRNPGQLLFTVERPAETNQRIWFDLDECDRYLFTGSSSGEVMAFRVDGSVEEGAKPVWSRRASNAALPGCSLHPSLPVVATCSGERVFPEPLLDVEEEEEREQGYRATREEERLENGVQLWRL